MDTKIKSYAAIYPDKGRMSILYDYDGSKKEVIEHQITEVYSMFDIEKLCEMWNDVKRKLDETLIKVCICIPYRLEKYKDTIMNSARNNGIKNYEVAAEYIVKSLEAIFQTDCELMKSNKIIWVCLTSNICVWQRKLLDAKHFFKDETFEGLVITSTFPPDIIISTLEFDKHLVNSLFPQFKMLDYAGRTENSTALVHALNLGYSFTIDDLKIKSLKESYTWKRTANLPLTEIHVGINTYDNEISVSYCFQGKQKIFSVYLGNGKCRKIEHILKAAEARLNGILGCICIYDHFNIKEFTIEWAKQIEFKKAEIINKRKEDYIRRISQLPFQVKRSDIVWIYSKSAFYNNPRVEDNYDIWHGYVFQENNSISHLDLKLQEIYHPKIVIFNNSHNHQYPQNFIKKRFPNCQLFTFNSRLYDHNYNSTLKYAQIMAEEATNSLEFPPVSNDKDVLNKKKPLDVINKSTDSNGEADSLTSEKFESTGVRQLENTIFTFPKQTEINNDETKIVGIDLGTSRCCAAVNRKNGLATVHLDNKGERLLPSFVSYNEENPICGQIVVNRMRQFSRSTVFDSKRIIGRTINDIEIDSNWPFRISVENNQVVIEVRKDNDVVQKNAEDVAADLLRHVKQKSEEFQGTKLTDAVITVPAAFTNNQKEATESAAKLAGFTNIHLLPEPIAAAFAYFIDQTIPENINVLLFDLGGGTLDVCIFFIKNTEIQVISNTGDTKLGGRDFDTVLFNYFKHKLDVNHGISLNRDKKFKLIIECQKIKEDLSSIAKCNLNIDEYDASQDHIISINREEFESMTKRLQNRIQNTLNAAIQTSKLNPKEIHKTLLVGGGSRMPMVKKILQEMFPDAEQCIHENPDEVVAIGAAYYAYSIFSNNTNE